ncbi:hypothetical protein TIFTF001_022234 [Ficus carica]|uniref:Uncharacterized protein n=1 Tax=Ficus carica TaxID=3494 RepID=A0AA88AHF1_FICCA|nr:hypothetical protein TIFTF001_022234 [Ficus carica]
MLSPSSSEEDKNSKGPHREIWCRRRRRPSRVRCQLPAPEMDAVDRTYTAAKQRRSLGRTNGSQRFPKGKEF